MASRPPNAQKSVIVKIRTTPQVKAYLEQLVAHGLYGKTAPEVANTLVSRGIEALIQNGHLAALHKSK